MAVPGRRAKVKKFVFFWTYCCMIAEFVKKITSLPLQRDEVFLERMRK
jgi:hypothetical protein